MKQAIQLPSVTLVKDWKTLDELFAEYNKSR
jgi:hypothetical protein